MTQVLRKETFMTIKKGIETKHVLKITREITRSEHEVTVSEKTTIFSKTTENFKKINLMEEEKNSGKRYISDRGQQGYKK